MNSLCNIVFCAVDSSFCNNISIDAIVVMGSFVVIEWLCTNTMRLGIFGYQILQKYEKSCCIVSLLSGLLVGAVCVVFAEPITYIFELTDLQRSMLKELLIAYGLCCPMESVSRFLQMFITYKCYNKLVIWANFGTYVLLILTDYIVIKLGYGVLGLVLSTELTWLVYLVIIWIGCKFHKQTDKISISKIMRCIKSGKNVLASRIVSRVANVILGHFASTMDTAIYAIHAVALSITNLAEEFRDAISDYTLVRLRDNRDNMPKEAKHVLKQCIAPAILLPAVASAIMTIVMHGKVDIISAYYGVALYSIVYLVMPLYDVVQAYVLSKDKATFVLVRGFISAFWRIAIMWVMSIYQITIFGIAIVYLLDYITSQIYYIFALKRSSSKTTKEVT